MKAVLLIVSLLMLPFLSEADLMKKENPVKATLVASQSAKAGSIIEAKVDIEIQKDWHLFSSKPEVPGITPTQIIIEPSDNFTVEKVTFPEANPVYSDVFEKTLSFYEGQISIPVQIKIKPEAKGEVHLKGFLKYQSCSNTLCLPPAKIQLFSTVKVNG
jgi:DsbC/DsbD-like thiol-disulfide interchange protein